MIAQDKKGQHLAWRIRSCTDNQSNAFGLHRWRLKTYPSYLFLMGTAQFSQKWGIYPAVDDTKREHNTWADQQTHMDFEGFSTQRRWRPSLHIVWPPGPHGPRPNKEWLHSMLCIGSIIATRCQTKRHELQIEIIPESH
eukprot:4495269-Amphidinium_carterae.2